MHKLENLILKEITESTFLEEKAKIAVALSGGPDSMALLFCLNKVAKILKLEIFPIHINHKLRKEADQESVWLKNYLKEYGIKCHIIEWEHEEIHSDIQNQARLNRYDLLRKFCQENNILTLVTGHHKNDIAENFFIRIEKESGVKGLSAIKKYNHMFGVQIMRPFLSVTKQELLQYVEDLNIKFIYDNSNSNEKYTRVKIRKFLENQNIINIENIVKISENLSITSNYIEESINLFIAKNVKIHKEGFISLTYSHFDSLNLEIKLKVIKFLTSMINPSNKTKTTKFKDNLKKISLNKKVSISGCFLILQKDDKLIICREYKEKGKLTAIDKHEFIFDNRFLISIPTTLSLENLYITYLDHQKYLSITKEKSNEKPWFTESIPCIKYNDQYYITFKKDTYNNNFFKLIKIVYVPLILS